MTTRLYYDEPYLRQFNAQVVACTTIAGTPAVALERSAFYPGGGGQPADQGTLDSSPVRDVQIHDGEVWHLLDHAKALAPGTHVHGVIDWTRRFDHMQQHLGQHILTAAFVATSHFVTTAFHLSATSVTIDLDTPTLSTKQAQAAEALANQVVWADHSVLARFVSPEQLATLPLRKQPSVSGPVRVVSIADFDHSPCGGTHPQSTGSVGIIAVQRWSAQQGGTRVTFACGGRVLSDYQRLNDLTTTIAARLSVGSDELAAAVERLQATGIAARKELEEARETLLDHQVEHLLTHADQHGEARVVQTILPAESALVLRTLAQHFSATPDAIALLGVAGDRPQLAVACGHAARVDARTVLQIGLSLIEGRGGGSTTLAQGGGNNPDGLAAALDAMAHYLHKYLA